MDPVIEHVDIESPDGPRLSCAVVPGAAAGTGRTMVFLHGIASHGTFYCDALGDLDDAVDALYLPDMRGHGRSAGARGEIVGHAELMEDVGRMVAFARRRHPGDSLVLAGESMGALLALAYAATGRGDVDALVLAAPALRLHFAKLLTPRRIGQFLPRALAAGLDGVPTERDPGDEVSRNPEFERLVVEDSRQLSNVGFRYLGVVASFMLRWRAYARRIGDLPTLILHGQADDLIDPAAIRALHRMLPRSELLEVSEAWHNLFFDPSAPEVLYTIRRWLKERVAPVALNSAGPRCGAADAR